MSDVEKPDLTIPAKISWATAFAYVGSTFFKGLAGVAMLALLAQCTSKGAIW